MSSPPANNSKFAALRVLAQQLEGIRAQSAELGQPRTAAVLPMPIADISIDDWDALLNAVKARLRLTVDESPTWQSNVAAAPVRASVLECVDALEQLHLALTRRLAGRADRTA
jgi:uncharacterized protein (DUF2267 family)